jgi:hypothetical protein
MSQPEDKAPGPPDRRVHDRRHRRIPWAFKPERRTGFDRRASRPGGPLTQALRELRDSERALLALLVAINLLNVLDLLLTLVLLEGGASEGNPVMRVLIGNDPLVALVVKVAIVLFVTIAIWRQRRHRIMLGLAVVVLLLFVALTAYEVLLVVA